MKSLISTQQLKFFFFARWDEPAGSPAAKPASCLAGLTSSRLATRPAVNTPRLAGWPPGRLWTPQRKVPAERKKKDLGFLRKCVALH